MTTVVQTKVPASPFATKFTKALSLAITYKGHLTAGSFNLTPTGEVSVELAEADAGAVGVPFFLGTTSNEERGLLEVTPDGWTKAWPGSKAIILGKSDPYPQGQLRFPGGYDSNKYAVPLEKGKITKGSGTLDLLLESAFYKGSTIELCGSSMQYTLDAGIPIVFLVLWLEASQTGKLEFPAWPGGGSKTITI